MDNADLTDLEAIYARSVGQKPPINFDVHVEGGPKAEQAFMDVCKLSQASGELIANLREARRMLESANSKISELEDLKLKRENSMVDLHRLWKEAEANINRLNTLKDVYSKEAFDLQAKLRDANLQLSEARKALWNILGTVQGSHPNPYKEIQTIAREALGTETRLGEGPTDRKCCTEAYARGHEVGKHQGYLQAAQDIKKNGMEGVEKRVESPEPRFCVKCGAKDPDGKAHPFSCIGKGDAAHPAEPHDCVGVRFCAVCNVRLG